MKVFISWSKDKSKLTAEALNKWLPKVIQVVEPWISPDIEKGKRWSQEINDNLEKTKIGIFCLNQENLNEPWILFEAGAMAKTKDAYVCTFLLDIKPTDVHQPLGQFQHTKYEKEDIRKLVHTINSALGKYNEKELTKEVLDEAFENRHDPRIPIEVIVVDPSIGEIIHWAGEHARKYGEIAAKKSIEYGTKAAAAGASYAISKAKESANDYQTKRLIDQAYSPYHGIRTLARAKLQRDHPEIWRAMDLSRDNQYRSVI